jgi:hypothetical protein
MSNLYNNHNPRHSTRVRQLLIAIILMLLLGSLSACSVDNAAPETAPLSLNTLEEQYGLRVNLFAVTAAGGFVDLRLKIVDADKAKALLQEPNNFPTLWIADGNITLEVPEENRAQELQYKDDGILLFMYPNQENSAKIGTPISIMFGELQLKPISIQ